MRGARRHRGGEGIDTGARPGREFYRPPLSESERKERRDAAIAMLAGVVPFRPIGVLLLSDAFGLSRQQIRNILARFRRGGGDAWEAPQLIVIGKDGKVITTEGRAQVTKVSAAATFSM